MTMQKKRQHSAAYDAFLEMARALEGEVTQGRQTEQTKRLASRAQAEPGLQRYSLLNQVLILRQFPEATEVHTFKGWREQGRRVKRGSKAIYIRAPRTRVDGEGEQIAGFRTMLVFDRLQTEPLQEGEASEASEMTQEGD